MYKVVILALLAITAADAFWSPCADHPGAVAPTNIVSASCSGNLCTVQRGEDLLADADITFTGAHNRLDVRVTAFVLGVPINLPVAPPDDDACYRMYRGGSLVGCPTVPGAAHVWRIIFNVPTTYPAFTNSRVRYELLDGGSLTACADIQTTVL